MTHTKGPWKMRDRYEGEVIEILDSEGYVLSLKGIGLKVGEITDEDRANARLIAAAPELLEACMSALNRMEQYNYQAMERTMERVREAIAKAEGR